MSRILAIFFIIITFGVVSSCSITRRSAKGRHVLTDVSYDIEDKAAIAADELFKSPETKSSKVYVIDEEVDLRNKYIILPHGSTLLFKKGKLSNGHIIGCETSIIALEESIFSGDVELSGTWNIEKAYSKWFEYDSDDMTKQVTWLLDRAMEGTLVVFENKAFNVKFDYNRNTVFNGYRRSAFYAEGQNIDIDFNGATILDKYICADEEYVNVFSFKGCSGRVIGLRFESIKTTYDINSDQQDGHTIVHCMDYCHDLELEISAECVRSCIESGVFSWHECSIYNSSIRAKIRNGGYAVALYDGKDLSINVDADIVHRGAYIGGCTNSNIDVVCGKSSTGVACLLTDSRLLIDNKRVFVMSSDLDVTTYCYCNSGENINNVLCSIYSDYGFEVRKEAYNVNLNVHSVLRPVSSAANIRVFNVYDLNSKDVVNAKINVDVQLSDTFSSNKHCVLYNNHKDANIPALCNVNLAYSGISTMPILLRQQHEGTYNIDLSDVVACANNPLYKTGVMDLVLGSKTKSHADSDNRILIGENTIAYVRRDSNDHEYSFPIIYSSPSSFVYFQEAELSKLLQIESTKVITAKAPYASYVFGTMYVERQGGNITMNFANPNGNYYWVTEGQKMIVYITNTSITQDLFIDFDDGINSCTDNVLIESGRCKIISVLYKDGKFNIVDIQDKEL